MSVPFWEIPCFPPPLRFTRWYDRLEVNLSPAYYVVWFGAMALEGTLVWVGARRRLLASMPVFFAYVAFHCIRDISYFCVWHYWPGLKYWFYWTGELIGLVLSYLLIFELWKKGLRAYSGIWRMSRWALGLAALGLLGIVMVTTEYATGAPAQPGQWITDWMRLLGRSVLFTQAAFLFSFFLVLGLFRVRVTSVVRGLALGWFGFSVIDLVLFSLRHFYGPMIRDYALARPLAFFLLLSVWSFLVWTSDPAEEVELMPTFVFRESERQAVVERMDLLNSSLQRILQG